MHDWMISKKRYWGLALPIYPCVSCGTFEVSAAGTNCARAPFAVGTVRRPQSTSTMDRFSSIACAKCNEPIKRILDVGNPWLDAGIVPYSTMHYNTDRRTGRNGSGRLDFESFPGQFRNWFYRSWR